MMTIVYFTDIYRNGMVFLPLFIHHSLYFNPLFSSFAIHAASSKVIFVFCAIVDAVGCCIFNVSHAEFNSRHVFQRRQTFFGSWNRVQSFRHVLQCWFAMLFKQLNKRKKTWNSLENVSWNAHYLCWHLPGSQSKNTNFQVTQKTSWKQLSQKHCTETCFDSSNRLFSIVVNSCEANKNSNIYC